MNSITFNISYFSLVPKATISTVFGVRISKTKPRELAPWSSALSSEIWKTDHKYSFIYIWNKIHYWNIYFCELFIYLFVVTVHSDKFIIYGVLPIDRSCLSLLPPVALVPSLILSCSISALNVSSTFPFSHFCFIINPIHFPFFSGLYAKVTFIQIRTFSLPSLLMNFILSIFFYIRISTASVLSPSHNPLPHPYNNVLYIENFTNFFLIYRFM